jgi:hypothetical protein
LIIPLNTHTLASLKNGIYVGKINQATYFMNIALSHILEKFERCLRIEKEIVGAPDSAF